MLGVTAVLLTALGFVKFRQVKTAVQAASLSATSDRGHQYGGETRAMAGHDGRYRNDGSCSGRDG